jgi:hypothetical protein
MPSAIDAVLKLRPSSVAHKLAGTRVCLLNARDVQRSRLGQPLLVCEVPALPIAAGVVRAARELRAVLGLSFPALPRGAGPRETAVFQAVVSAVTEAGFELPFFLRGGPVPLADAAAGTVAEARESVWRFVDAGFTEVALDVSCLSPAMAAAVVDEVAVSLRERELSLEIVTRSESAAEIGALRAALGASVDVLAIPEAALASEGLAEAVAPTALCVADPRDERTAGRVQRVLASICFGRIAALVVSDEAKAGIRQRALGGWRVPAAIAGAFSGCTLGEAELLRIEALAFHEALELLAGAEGSGAESIAFLAGQGGC